VTDDFEFADFGETLYFWSNVFHSENLSGID